MKYEEKKLSELVDTISDTRKIDKDKVVLVNTSDVLAGEVLNHTYTENCNLRGQFKKRFKTDDILYSEIRPANKRFAYIDFDSEDYIASTKLMILRRKSDKITNRYLYYCLTNDLFVDRMQHLAEARSGTFPQITFDVLKGETIYLPSIANQNKITSILDNINNKIRLNNEINNNLLEQCRCLYKEWFIDFNFISKGVKYKDNNGKMIESEKGLIPVGWIYKRIDELDLDISDGNYSSKYPTKQEFQTEGIPFIRGTDFNGYSISRKNLMYITPEKHEILKKGHLKKNDILITTRGEIGRIVFVSDYFIDSNINAQLIRINGDKRYPRSFLGMSLISDYVQNDIKSLVTGTALQQLPVGKFNQVKIIVPDDEEIIKSFDSIVEVALKKIQENEEQNEILEQLRDTLLPKLINGEINLDNI